MEKKDVDLSSACAQGYLDQVKVLIDGYTDVVKVLIERGGDIDVKNNDGWTALMVAESKGYSEIIEILKKAGAK